MLDMRHSFNHTIHFKQKIDFFCTSFSFFIININIINYINLLLPHDINMPEQFFSAASVFLLFRRFTWGQAHGSWWKVFPLTAISLPAPDSRFMLFDEFKVFCYHFPQTVPLPPCTCRRWLVIYVIVLFSGVWLTDHFLKNTSHIYT